MGPGRYPQLPQHTVHVLAEGGGCGLSTKLFSVACKSIVLFCTDGSSTEAVVGPADLPEGATWPLACGQAQEDDGGRQQNCPLSQVIFDRGFDTVIVM